MNPLKKKKHTNTKKPLTSLLKDSGSSTTSLLLVRILQTSYEKLQKFENKET